MKLWKSIAVAVMAVVALSLTPTAFAADKEDGKKPEAAAAAHKGHQCTGEIVAISADSITVKAKSGEVKFDITSSTKYGTKTEPKAASDFKAGDKVKVMYKEDGDKKVATSIGMPAAKKK